MALLTENRNRVPLITTAPAGSVEGELRGQMRMLETEGNLTLYVCSTSSLLAAALTVDSTPANSDVTFVANLKGVAGNSITVAFIDPATADAPLSVVVSGPGGSPETTDIVVNLATDNGSPIAISSTAAQVRDAVNANLTASALVTATAEGSGAGVVEAAAEAPLAGGDDDGSVWSTLTLT